MGAGRKADIQPGKKLPVLPLAIGGVAVTVVLVICLVLFFGGKRGGVFGTDCDLMAAKQVLGYDVFYPDPLLRSVNTGKNPAAASVRPTLPRLKSVRLLIR